MNSKDVIKDADSYRLLFIPSVFIQVKKLQLKYFTIGKFIKNIIQHSDYFFHLYLTAQLFDPYSFLITSIFYSSLYSTSPFFHGLFLLDWIYMLFKMSLGIWRLYKLFYSILLSLCFKIICDPALDNKLKSKTVSTDAPMCKVRS